MCINILIYIHNFASSNFEIRQWIFRLPNVLYCNVCHPYGACLIIWRPCHFWRSFWLHDLKITADGNVKCSNDILSSILYFPITIVLLAWRPSRHTSVVQLESDSEDQDLRWKRVVHMHKFHMKFAENFSIDPSSNVKMWINFSPFWLWLRDEFGLALCDAECTINFVRTI